MARTIDYMMTTKKTCGLIAVRACSVRQFVLLRACRASTRFGVRQHPLASLAAFFSSRVVDATYSLIVLFISPFYALKSPTRKVNNAEFVAVALVAHRQPASLDPRPRSEGMNSNSQGRG